VSDLMPLGYQRAWVAAAACAIMLAVGGAQYGCAALAVRLGLAHHWGPLAAGCGCAAWLACQAAAGGALRRCRRRLSVPPARTAVSGAACCALGLLLSGAIANPAGAIAADAVAAGAGAGLVYQTCATVAADWFPARHIPAALVSWAFAVLLVALAAAIAQAPPSGVLAWAAVTVTALCAPLLRAAPRPWRPSGQLPQPLNPWHCALKHRETRRYT
jgi:hypothetical protein